MDIFAQLPNLAGVGLGGTLVLVVLYLLRSNYNDRSQHRETIAAIEASSREALKSRDDQLVERRRQIIDLEAEVDRERDLRRRAEDAAAAAERTAIINEARISALQGLAEGRSNARSPTTRLDAIPPRPVLDAGESSSSYEGPSHRA